VLRRCVEAAIRSASLTGPDAEVLVVVNGRGDAPGLGPVDSPMVRVVYLDQPNVSAARNCAITKARHDVVLFADDDVLVPEPWCTQLRAALADEGAAVVTAPVRVPVSGPVTALVNYQRKFDSQPPRPDDPGTLLTANFGLRRDLVPGDVRFDERFTVVGEDADFSYQLWTAGIHFRLLTGATEVPHELPEGLEPVIERSMRYGKGTVLSLAKRGLGPKLLPAFGPWYQTVTNPDYDRSCRYAEIVRPDVRDAFRIYAAILNFGYLVGVLHALGNSLGQPVVRLDLDQMTAAWERAAERANERVAGLSEADWQSLPLDYSRLGDPVAGTESGCIADAVIVELKTALCQHAPIAADLASNGRPAPNGQPGSSGRPGPNGEAGSSGRPGPNGGGGAAQAWASFLVGPTTRGRVRAVLDELRDRRDTPISKADLDNFARSTGLPFRVCCELVEREFYQLA
jgi:glycosyltransferase involved in cell wall biosynthesis